MNPLVAAITRSSARRSVLRRETAHTGRHGTAIDRWYSDAFLRRQAGAPGYIAGDFTGHVLEVDARRVILHGIDVAEARHDTVVCALSLQHAADPYQFVRSLARALKPGGVLLATVPCIGPLTSERDDAPVFWRPTALGLRRLAETAFPAAGVTVQSFGNLVTATGHLYGLTASDMRRAEREVHDPDFPVVVAVRAVLPRIGGPSS